MPKKQKKTYRKYNSDIDTLDFSFSYNDEETAKLHERVNGNPTIDINDLRRISLWKINRVLRIEENAIEKLRKLARMDVVSINDDFVKEVIDELINSQGIGFPMASAILKFINPEVFPIIDVRAYRALTGVKPYYSTYNYKKYVEYTEALMEIARLNNNQPLREVDEQLYCFDKEHNEKI